MTPYAGIASRAVALAIDALLAHVIVLSAGAVLALVASLVGDANLDTAAEILAGVAWTAVVGFYFVLFWSTVGQTPGMRVMALRVVRRTGGHPGIGRSVARVVVLALAIIPLFAGFVAVLFDARRRGLHDMLAGTVVVYDGAEPAGVRASPDAHQTASLQPPVARPTMGTHTTPRRRTSMSSLVAVAYPDRDTAERVRQELIQMTKERLVELEDAVVVVNEDGKIKLHQAMSTTGAGAAGGALWGGLIGLIFLAPLLGMAVGAASGAVGGKMADVGVDDTFMKDLGARLQPGAAALIALGSSNARDKVIERVRPYGGEILQTSLSTEAEEQLRAAIAPTIATA